MPKNSSAKKTEDSQSSQNIQIPPIRKQTAGAVAGAAVGSIVGPMGAVVGGVVGAVVGKAAEKGQPIAPAARRTVRSVMKPAISKTPQRRRPSKTSSAKQRKAGARSQGKAKKTTSSRSTTTRSRKGSISGRQSKSPLPARKRSSGRRKRH